MERILPHKPNLNVMKVLFTILISFSISIALKGQEISKIQDLVPPNTYKTYESISPMPPYMLHLNYTADVKETNACLNKSTAYGGLKVEISWYNNNDETGKMMLSMVSNQADVEKKYKEHKTTLEKLHALYKDRSNETGFTFTGVEEENVPGGKMHYITARSTILPDCERKSTVITNANCFFFNGTAHGTLSISAYCTIDEIRAMVLHIIKSTADYDFSTLLK
jgi:hypothetical protein